MSYASLAAAEAALPVANSFIDYSGNYVFSGCAVSANSDLSVTVASGAVGIHDKSVNVAGGSVYLAPADITNDRLDLIVVDQYGNMLALAGVPSTNPAYPANLFNTAILAGVYVPAQTTAMQAGYVLDKRNLQNQLSNSGQATIAASGTSITVNHGLAATPVNIQVTPGADPATNWFVNGITSTQFVINVHVAVAGNTLFYWRAMSQNG